MYVHIQHNFASCLCGSELTKLPQPNGAEKAIDPLEGITEKEQALLTKAIEDLKGNIAKGVDFAHNPPQK